MNGARYAPIPGSAGALACSFRRLAETDALIQAEKANARRVPQQARRLRSPEQMRARITLLLFSTVFFFVYLACFVGDSLTSMPIDQEFICPRCRTPLEQVRTPKGSFWACQKCNGRAISVELLRRIFTPGSINPLWLHAISGTGQSGRLCPVCDKPMLEVKLADDAEVNVDVCRACHFVWFDAGETETLVPKKPMPPPEPMPQKAREAVALLKVKQLAKEAERREFSPSGLFWYDIADVLTSLVLSALKK